jgi:acyl dehydratase
VIESFPSMEALEAAVGRQLGPTIWRTVDQELVTGFADLTRDHNWIHVDEARAAGGPFGGTIAHGYLTLSLIPSFSHELFSLDLEEVRLNYGLNKVRFPRPVLVGSRIRAWATITGLPTVGTGRQLTVEYTIEVEHQEKPACVAETVVLLVAG